MKSVYLGVVRQRVFLNAKTTYIYIILDKTNQPIPTEQTAQRRSESSRSSLRYFIAYTYIKVCRYGIS